MGGNREEAIEGFKALIRSTHEMIKPFENGTCWFGGRGGRDEKAVNDHVAYLRSLIEMYEQQLKLLR